MASPLTEVDHDLAVNHAPYRFSPAVREGHDAPNSVYEQVVRRLADPPELVTISNRGPLGGGT